MNLTERDKKLLVLLGVILLLFVFGKFLIFPLMGQINTNNDEIFMLELDAEDMENKIINLVPLQQERDANMDTLGTTTADYYDLLPNQEVERLMTNMALKNGLVVQVMDIRMATDPMQVVYYRQSEGQATTMFFAHEVDMKVTGTAEAEQALLDELFNDNPSILVTGFRYDDNHDLRVSVKIITCNKQVFN